MLYTGLDYHRSFSYITTMNEKGEVIGQKKLPSNGEIGLLPYEMPGELQEAIKVFIEYYNYQRYHEGLGDATPCGVYTDRHLEVLQRRKEAKNRTLQARRDYDRINRE